MSTPNSTHDSAPGELLTLRQLAKAIGVDAGQLSKESHRPGFPGHATDRGTLYVAAEVLAFRHANVRQKKPRDHSSQAAPMLVTRSAAPPLASMPAAASSDRPSPAPAVRSAESTSRPTTSPPAMPPGSATTTSPPPALSDPADDSDLAILKSSDTTPVEKTDALVNLVARRLARAHELAGYSPNDVDALKKSLQELRTAKADYIKLEEEQRRLIPRDDARAIAVELCMRLSNLLDSLEARVAIEFTAWLADPAVAAMNAEDRNRMIRRFFSEATRAARITEADQIERLLDQPRDGR